MAYMDDNLLGSFLRSRRARLDPATFGFGTSRRRTPGLRREEVAQRADVSVTWYTWLEQGREGAPSIDVLYRLADALTLSPPEREHLFLIAKKGATERAGSPQPIITPRLQRVLDALVYSPALVKTSTWDVLAWNVAASKVLTDYASLEPERRNILRLLFGNPDIRRRNLHWETQAKLLVSTFRLESARTGHPETTRALVEEMSLLSPEFATLWAENDVNSYGEGVKHIDHPIAGPLALEFSTFAVDGQPDLSLLVYTAATPSDLRGIQTLVDPDHSVSAAKG